MSQVPIPPRDSSKGFSEKVARRKKAEQMIKEARKSTDSLASWESAEYWTCRKRESEASLAINEIDRELAEEKITEADQKKYLKTKAELEEETETAERKIRRYEARSRIVEAAKTTNPASMRASYLELMMSHLSKTSRINQGAFILDLKQNYGCKVMGTTDHVWCPMLGEWWAKSEIEAAHLFPLSLGQETMSYIFGDDAKNEINKAPNGLFLHGTVEEAFDRHKIIIVPCEGETKPQEWKFLVLDRGGQWNAPLKVLGKGCTFADLHQRKLIFEPTHSSRPRARYLYFHYVMAMLRLGRGKQAAKAGVTSHMPELTSPALSTVWATQGRYLRESMIRAFIEGIGHEDTDAEIDEMLSHAMSDLPNETTRMVETAKQMKVESDEEGSSDDDW